MSRERFESQPIPEGAAVIQFADSYAQMAEPSERPCMRIVCDDACSNYGLVNSPTIEQAQVFFFHDVMSGTLYADPLLNEPLTPDERMFASKAREERIFEPPEADEAHPHADFSQPMLEPSYALDDSHPVAPDHHAATEGISEEYAYDELKTTSRRGGHTAV